MGCSFERDYNNASKMLGYAAEYIRARTEEKSRYWYLSAAAATTAPFLVAGVTFWITRTFMISSLGETVFWLSITACLGASGAFFSVITRTGLLTANSASGRAIHFIDAASRIFAGAISAVVVVLAIRSKLFLSITTETSSAHLAAALAAIAAGFSERIAPSIMANFEKADTTTNKIKTTPLGDSPELRSKTSEQKLGEPSRESEFQPAEKSGTRGVEQSAKEKPSVTKKTSKRSQVRVASSGAHESQTKNHLSA
jgi:hypothetical protein